MSRRLLITGGAGYLGSHILHRLAKPLNGASILCSKFDSVDVIDDLSTGFVESLPTVYDNKDSRFQFHKLDLRNEAACQNFFLSRQYDTIIHLAGKLKVSESVTNPLSYYSSNVVSLLNLLKEIPPGKKTKFIFSSTGAVYGNLGIHSPLSEDSALAPASPYGQSKLICEQMLADYKRTNSGFSFVALRYFNIAGAADDLLNGQRTSEPYHLIHLAAKVAVGKFPALRIYGDQKSTKDGTCIRDYIHVEDLVDIHLLAFEYLENCSQHQIINCGYQNEYSVKDVISAMERVLGSKLNVSVSGNRPGDPDYAVASNERIRREFGWKPQRENIFDICKSALEWERRILKSELGY